MGESLEGSEEEAGASNLVRALGARGQGPEKQRSHNVLSGKDLRYQDGHGCNKHSGNRFASGDHVEDRWGPRLSFSGLETGEKTVGL